MSSSLVARSSQHVELSISKIEFDERSNTELTFVNLTEPKQSKDRGLKKIVRSTVMRTYRQKEKRKAVFKWTQTAGIGSESSKSPLFDNARLVSSEGLVHNSLWTSTKSIAGHKTVFAVAESWR